MATKTYSAPLELKAAPAQPGEFRAIFATLNVKDLDGDVTVPGAFRDGQDVRIAAWGHDWGSLPVGLGTIHADQQKAWVDGRFFLDTPAGDATYKTVKSLGALQEWSYGFEVTKWSVGQFQDQEVRFLEGLNVFEVSPVMIGAGIGTGTDAIKSAAAKAALKPHSTATSDGAWDGPAMWTRLPSEAGALRAACAWVDPNGDPATKDTYRFIHHEVSSDGKVGAANTKACSTGIGVLNGGRGGTTIPDADKAGVHAHLAKHLADAGMEPPPLKSADGDPFLSALDLLDLATKAGARNSGADMERIQKVHDLMTELGAACSAPKSAQPKALRDQAADVIGDLEAYVQRLAVVSPEEAWDAQEWVPGVLARAEKARQALSSVVRLATERETLHPRGLEREFRRLEAQYQVGQARNAAHGRLA